MRNSDVKKIDSDLIGYLPAAKALYYKDASVFAKAVGFLIAAMLIIFIVWASIFQIDISVSAQGKIISSNFQQKVRALRTGMIGEFLVKEGDIVTEGQILLSLDSNEENIQYNFAVKELIDLKSKQTDLELLDAVFQSGIEGRQNADVLRSSIENIDLIGGGLFASNMFEYRAILTRLYSESRVIRAELNELNYLETLRLGVIQRKINEEYSLNILVENDALPLSELSSAIMDRAQAENELESLGASRAKLEEKLAGVDAQLRSFQFSKLSDISKLKSELSSSKLMLESRIEQLTYLIGNSKIRAPRGGSFFGAEVNSTGELVSSGEVLGNVVEDGDSKFELIVKSQDMGFVYLGQEITVRLDAYSFTKYGSIDGLISYIDPTSFSDEQGRLLFKVRAEMVENNIKVFGKTPSLQVGQSVSANILVGKRTVMEYILSPISRGIQNGINEI